MATKWYPGKAIVRSVQITNTVSGATQQMGELVFEISVQASLYDYNSFCEIQVFDAVNFLSNFPVESGNAVKIKIEYQSGMKEYEYYVSKITNIEQIDKERTYKLECISKLGYKSMSKKWSAAYQGTCSDIAKQIFDEFSDGSKTAIWEQSKGQRTFISPNWTPNKALGYLANEAISMDGKNRMVFFENTKQEYHFCPVETLGKKGSVFTFIYNQYTTDQERQTWDDQKIMETPYGLRHLDEQDWLDAVNKGALSTAVVQTDVTKKSLNYWWYNYWEQWDQNFHLNPKPLWNHQEVDPGKIGLRNHFNQADFENDYQLEDDSITRPSLVSTGQLIELNVVGNIGIDAGSVVTVNIPPPEPEATLNGGKRNKWDVSWSGKWYVLGLRTVYYKNRGESVTSMTCCKESLIISDAT